MYISMIRLRRDISLHDMASIAKGDGYQIHKLVWKLFADHPDRKRDFIYRHKPVNGWPNFYTVSQRAPLDASGMWEVTSKEYCPKLRAGQLLGFTLCANPIRSKRDVKDRQHRHDVIMEAKVEVKMRGETISVPDLIQDYGCRWLLDRAASHGFGATPEGIRVDGYRQHRLFKGKGNHAVSFSTVDFNGVLTVTDPDIFLEKCLFDGVGPAKGFGCGLMMVRRI
jgi:CRISPR system Cascade subunit CasE